MSLAVGIPPVQDAQREHHEVAILVLEDHPPVPHAEPVEAALSGELQRIAVPGLGEALDGNFDPGRLASVRPGNPGQIVQGGRRPLGAARHRSPIRRIASSCGIASPRA